MHSLWLCIFSAITANAWITPQKTRTRVHHRHLRALTNDDNDDTETLFQRTFYRLSPGSDVDIHNSIVIEDRLFVDVASERDASNTGHRTILLRDGNVQDGEIGDAFFSLSPETTVSTSEIAMALYLASNPSMCTEDMLEVSSETGLASILGCIGAGFVLRRDHHHPHHFETTNKDVADDILTISKPTDKLLPENFEKLTLTAASDERHMQVLVRNSQHSGIAPGKLLVEPLDWRRVHSSRQTVLPEVSTTIVAVDLALTYPEAIALARTCAYRLRPSWVGREDGSKPIPRFVHVCPNDGREDVAYLQRELTNGYKMITSTGYVQLEKIVFVPQRFLPQSTTSLDDVEWEVQNVVSLTFTSLLAQHHSDYVGGGSGELFFPADTGARRGFRETGV